LLSLHFAGEVAATKILPTASLNVFKEPKQALIPLLGNFSGKIPKTTIKIHTETMLCFLTGSFSHSGNKKKF